MRHLWIAMGLLALLLALLAFFADKLYDWRHGDDKEWPAKPLNEDPEIIEVMPDSKM